MKQYIVDAFTDKIFSGNPAAACVLDSWQWEAYDSRLNSLLNPQPIPNDNNPWIYP